MSVRLRLALTAWLLVAAASSASAESREALSPPRDIALPAGAIARFGEPTAGRLTVEQIVFSQDGTILAAIRGGRFQLWDLKTAKEIGWPGEGAKPDGPWPNAAVSIALSPDGKTLASSTMWEATIQLRDVAAGKQRGSLTGGQNNVLAFAPDGKTLASSSVFFCRGRCGDLSGGDSTLRLWDPAAGEELWRKPNMGGHCLAFSPDGKVLAVATHNSICLLQAATGATRLTFGRDNEFIFSLAYSPDGKYLASAGAANGSNQAVCRLWEVATGQEVCATESGSDRAQALAFVPHSGRIVASVPSEGCIRCWDPLAGTESRDERVAAPAALAFSGDGKLLATGASKNGTILLWDVAKLVQSQRPKLVRLSSSELASRWEDLSRDDAAKAYRAMAALVADPEQAVTFLQARLRPVPPVPAARLDRLLADLDSDRFVARKRATEELEQLGELADPSLRRALAHHPSLEMSRRIEQLLIHLDNRAWTPPAEELRPLRAVTVLERIGTPEARRVLAVLADGAAGARLTREAQSSLTRLRQWSSKP
jgi:hypothetical protein